MNAAGRLRPFMASLRRELPGYLALLVIFGLWSCSFIYLPNHPQKVFTDPDEVLYMVRSVNVYHALSSHSLKAVLSISREYPPLPYGVSAVAYWLWGISPLSLFVSYSFFVLLFMLALYWLGGWLGSPEYRWLLLAWGLFSPSLISESATYMGDLPVLALVSLCLYLGLRTQHFTRTRYVIAFSLMAALGWLTKFTFVYYWLPLWLAECCWQAKTMLRPGGKFLAAVLVALCGVVLLGVRCAAPESLVQVLATHPFAALLGSGVLLAGIFAAALGLACTKGTPEAARNLLVSFSLTLTVALPWYIMHINDFINKIFIQQGSYVQLEMTLGFLFASYFHILMQFIPFQLPALIAGLGFALSGAYLWETALCLLTLGVAYLLTCSTAVTHQLHYVLPALVLVLLPATLWLNRPLAWLSRGFKALGCLILLGGLFISATAYLPEFRQAKQPDYLSYRLVPQDIWLKIPVPEFNRAMRELSRVILQDYRPAPDFSRTFKLIAYNTLGMEEELGKEVVYYLAPRVHQEFLLDYMRNSYARIPAPEGRYFITFSLTPERLVSRNLKWRHALELPVRLGDAPRPLYLNLYKN